jgi:hypothetical protein
VDQRRQLSGEYQNITMQLKVLRRDQPDGANRGTAGKGGRRLGRGPAEQLKGQTGALEHFVEVSVAGFFMAFGARCGQ